MTCETSGPEEALCAGVPAAPSPGTGHTMDGVEAGVKTFGLVVRLRLKNWQAEASNWAGFRKLEKGNVSSILNRLVTCQVAPKSRAAYT